MLVLTRKAGQKIIIPDLNIHIRVIGNKNNIVRLGVAAPPHIKITRCICEKENDNSKKNFTRTLYICDGES
jgi:carbon storage regulator CsrA